MAEDGNLAAKLAPDLGKERGLSKATLALFSVSVNGTGWYWSTKLKGGGHGIRWKSFLSERPTDDSTWAKYRWMPERPDGADYFLSPEIILTNEIKAQDGELYLVGGEIDAMTMIEAGFRNVICFFGDSNVPDNFIEDIQKWGVRFLFMIPDRDEAGQKCAFTVRNRLRETDIEFRCYELPFTYSRSHGKDINDLWLDCNLDKEAFSRKILSLPIWILPTRTEEKPIVFPDPNQYPDSDLPPAFIRDIERLLEIQPVYGEKGYTRKPVLCPMHNEDTPSAFWNHDKKILTCFGSCQKTYLAKDVGERFGLRLAEYFASTPAINIIKLPTITVPANVDPKTGEIKDPEPASPIKQEYSPLLPDEAKLTDEQLKEAAKGRIWLDCYVNWAAQASPLSPDFFHEALGLWTLATAATRRMKIVIGGENIYPNLYLMIVAPTTAYRKTSALKLTHRILREAKLDFLLMPERATPEALFEYLAGKLPVNYNDLGQTDQEYWCYGRTFAAQRAIIEDEASGLLTEMKKDYMAGLSEILLKGYDGEGLLRKLLKTQGLISVKDMCLSFMGATTPVEWSRRMTNEERQNGFVARFAIITPEGVPVYKETADEIAMPDDIVRGVRRMFMEILPWHDYLLRNGEPHPLTPGGEVEPPAITSLSVTPPALAQMKKYRKVMGFDLALDIGDDKAASYARLGTTVYKVAMLLAAVDTFQRPICVEAKHAYAAQLICERWRESLHRLDIHVAQAKYNGLDEKILNFIRPSGELGVTLRDILRGCNVDNKDLQNNLKMLADSGAIEMFQHKPEGRGRPSLRYKAVSP